MYIFGNDHDLAQLGHCRFWAERGFIRIEDSRDNSFETISVKTALERVDAINAMIGNSVNSRDAWYRDEVRTYQTFIEKMLIIIKKAQEQGMPGDKAACRDLARRRSKSISMASVPNAYALPL